MSWLATLLMAIAAGFVAANGGRAQWLVARLSQDLGASRGLLSGALATSSITMGVAAWLGAMAGANLGEAALQAFAAACLLGATGELLWPVREPRASEPTRSLGAISLVLMTRQVFDAPRLIVLAAATQVPDTDLLGLGGAIGTGFCLWLAWEFGEIIERQFSTVIARGIMGLILLVLGGLLASEAVRLSTSV